MSGKSRCDIAHIHDDVARLTSRATAMNRNCMVDSSLFHQSGGRR